MFLPRLFGKYCVVVQCPYALVSGVRAKRQGLRKMQLAFFEEPEIVHTTHAKSGGDNFVLTIDDQLRFERVTFLFAGIVLFLLVFPPFF